MTVSEAILILNANAVIACERAGFDSTTVTMVEDALDIIEDALKVQEAVRPKLVTKNLPYHYACGTCGKYLPFVGAKYCSYCGRAVKWE